jgi:hydroxyacylglutathione hydrolase
MIIKKLMAGIYGANCYIVMDEDSKETMVLDPGGDVDDIEKAINILGAKVKYILLTHGHFDHTTGVDGLQAITKAEVAIGSEDDEMILKGMQYYGPFIEGGAHIKLNHGDSLTFGKYSVKCIATPGHTPGGMCFLVDNHLFSGDTLFKGSIGRSDLAGGNGETLINSIKEKLMILPKDIIVYPGHGPSTTIGDEAIYNPFL